MLLVSVVEKVVCVLGSPTLSHRKSMFVFMVVILCHLGVGIIQSWVIHTNTGTLLNHTLLGRIIIKLLKMVEVVLVLVQTTSPPKI